MTIFKLTETENHTPLHIKGKGIRQHHPETATLLGINEDDHDKLCAFFRNAGNGHVRIVLPSGADLQLTDWEFKK